MKLSELDLSAFEKLIDSLQEALAEQKKDVTNLFVRDSCIQRFEYTYELSHKMLKRYLEITAPNPQEVDHWSFQNLIRTGSEQGLLLSDWESWKKFRQSRGTTSHAYHEEKAIEFFRDIPRFLKEAQYLLQQLQERVAAA